MMPVGIKTGPTLGVTSLNQRNKDVEFICEENDSGERSRAIMALLFTLYHLQILTISTKLGQNKISDEFDYGFNRTRTELSALESENLP